MTPIRLMEKIKSEEKLRKHCEGYFKDIWFTSTRFGQVEADYKDVWSHAGPERSWRFQHHSLTCVAHLVDGYEELNDLRYLKKAEELIFNWHEVNYPDSPSEMGWHDHSTAYRLTNICRFYYKWYGSPLYEEQVERRLASIVVIHAEKLMDEEFYRPNHNHGLEQDIALFTAAATFSGFKDAKTWKERSISRFWKQVDYLFADDGSFLEHSPQYVYSLLKTLYRFLDYLHRAGYEQADKLDERLFDVTKFLVSMSRPDWRIPSIGDSENVTVSPSVMKNWSNRTERLLENLLNNMDSAEKPPIPVDSVFFEGGFAAFRNKWSWDEDAVQFITYSGFHSRVHKHHDDLSFILFSQGRELLTDGGKYNYIYTAEERKYVVSPFGHNSVMVDGAAAGIPNRSRGKSGFLSSMLTKNVAYVSGMHALYKDVNHRRMYLYLKPDVMLIFDRIRGFKNHTYETHFNFHNDLVCERFEDSFNGSLNGEGVIRLRQLYSSTGSYVAEAASGRKDPLKGWLSPEYGKLVPNTLLSYKTEGIAADNVYQISLGKALKKEEWAEVEWDGAEIRVRWRNYKVDIRLTDLYEHIFINDKHFRSTKHMNPRLIEAVYENDVEHAKTVREKDKKREEAFI